MFAMFKDELLKRLNADMACEFVTSIINCDSVCISGAKRVQTANDCQIEVATKFGAVVLQGESLKVVEVGDGEVYVQGDIVQVQFVRNEKNVKRQKEQA